MGTNDASNMVNASSITVGRRSEGFVGRVRVQSSDICRSGYEDTMAVDTEMVQTLARLDL